MNTTYSINNLADYFAAIDRFRLKDYISRGEAGKYPAIQSSAFRPFAATGKYYTQKHLQDYYNCIGNHLTDLQRKHFLAYAQHSGLPTNLIDFSTSPLVSLFFSSYEEGRFAENSEGENHGYVHFIRKNRLFPIDLRIEQGYTGGLTEPFRDTPGSLLGSWMDQFDPDKTKRFFDFDEPTFKKDYIRMLESFVLFLKEQLPDYEATEMDHKLKKLCDKIILQFSAFSGQQSGFDCIQETLLDFLAELEPLFESGDIIEDIVRTEESLSLLGGQGIDQRYFDIPFVTDGWNCNGMSPISAAELLNILVSVAGSFAVYSTKNTYYLPFYATYSPPNISGRVSMQNSIFICQTYIGEVRHKNLPDPKTVLVTQEILPDVTLEICDKKQILEELDMVGINLKTIYGDDDSIAKYIKNKL